MVAYKYKQGYDMHTYTHTLGKTGSCGSTCPYYYYYFCILSTMVLLQHHCPADRAYHKGALGVCGVAIMPSSSNRLGRKRPFHVCPSMLSFSGLFIMWCHCPLMQCSTHSNKEGCEDMHFYDKTKHEVMFWSVTTNNYWCITNSLHAALDSDAGRESKSYKQADHMNLRSDTRN